MRRAADALYLYGMLVSRTLTPPSLQLATVAPPDVAPGVSVVGIGTRAAREDHTHQGIGRVVYPGQDLQAAIDAAGDAGGGLVTLMPGVHAPPTAILLRSNVSLRGIEGHPFLTTVQGTLWVDGLSGFMAFHNFTVDGIFLVGDTPPNAGSAFMIFRLVAFNGNHANVNVPGFPPPATVPGFVVNSAGYGYSFTGCAFAGDGEAGLGASAEFSGELIDCEFRGQGTSPPTSISLGGGWADNLTVRGCRFRGIVNGTPSKPKTFRASDCIWQADGPQTYLTSGNSNVTWELVRARLESFGSAPKLGSNGTFRVDDVFGAVLSPDAPGVTADAAPMFRANRVASAFDPSNVVTLDPLPAADVVRCAGDGVSDFAVNLPPASRTAQGARVVLINDQGTGKMDVVPNGADTIRFGANLLLDWAANRTGVELVLVNTDWTVVAIRGAIP